MKNNLKQLFMGCVIASLFFACSSEQPKSEELCETETVEVSPINPNGDSELALLMRKMYDDAEVIKQAIIEKKGTITSDYINQLAEVHSAIPTDKDVKTPEFKSYTELLIAKAENLSELDTNRVEGFNNLVGSCIECHQSFCPGPIKKIKKLYIRD